MLSLWTRDFQLSQFQHQPRKDRNGVDSDDGKTEEEHDEFVVHALEDEVLDEFHVVLDH